MNLTGPSNICIRKQLAKINSGNKILRKRIFCTISRLCIILRLDLTKYSLSNTKSQFMAKKSVQQSAIITQLLRRQLAILSLLSELMLVPLQPFFTQETLECFARFQVMRDSCQILDPLLIFLISSYLGMLLCFSLKCREVCCSCKGLCSPFKTYLA